MRHIALVLFLIISTLFGIQNVTAATPADVATTVTVVKMEVPHVAIIGDESGTLYKADIWEKFLPREQPFWGVFTPHRLRCGENPRLLTVGELSSDPSEPGITALTVSIVHPQLGVVVVMDHNADGTVDGVTSDAVTLEVAQAAYDRTVACVIAGRP